MTRGLRQTGAVLGLCGLAGAALAEEELPAFGDCMNAEIARYERDLHGLKGQGIDDPVFNIASGYGVEYCGTIGIVRCDRSQNPLDCQQSLAQEQDVLRNAVLSGLPEPGGTAEAKDFEDQLYLRVHALAHGRSAGPDCAGAELRFERWCEAREANSRLRNAVLAWQVARYLERALPAIEAGWASPPPPVRPQSRPGSEQ